MVQIQSDSVEVLLRSHSAYEVQRLEAKVVRTMTWVELPHLYHRHSSAEQASHMSSELGIPCLVQLLVYSRSSHVFETTIMQPVEELLQLNVEHNGINLGCITCM